MDFTRLFDILDYQQERFPQTVALAGRESGVWRKWRYAFAPRIDVSRLMNR